MAKMHKTIDKAEQTARNAREAVVTGVDETRTLAAEVLEAIGSGVRRETGRAGHATEKAGARIGDTLEQSAHRVRPARGLFFGYFRRHPMQVLVLFGLMTGVVALIAIPMLGKGSQPEDQFARIRSGLDLAVFSAARRIPEIIRAHQPEHLRHLR